MSSSSGSERSTHYRVRLAPRALRDVESQYAYIARDAPEAAEQFVAALFDALMSLAVFPKRCPLADLEELAQIGLRQLVFRRLLVLFTIDEEGRRVHVLHIRHAARRSFLERGGSEGSARGE